MSATCARQVLAEDLPRDCANLPITGGWGYTRQQAIVFVRDQFPNPSSPNFVSLEYLIAMKIAYEELIICRSKNDRFSEIRMTPTRQQLINDGERCFDCLDFDISCWHDWHWYQLKHEFEEQDIPNRTKEEQQAHFTKKAEAMIVYKRQFWFDITDVHEPSQIVAK